MTKRTDWIPLIVIPVMVYLNWILGAPTSLDRPLLPTQAEQVLHDPAPEREGEIAARESLEPEGSLKTSGQHRKMSLPPKLGTSAQNGLTGRRDAQFIAPVQGVDAKGSAFVWERNPKWPMIEFRMRLKQPNTLIDR